MALLKIKTDLGMVEGLPANNQAVSVFKGIPFVKPPAGDLRWRPPQTADPWLNVYEAYTFKDICSQPRFVSEGGNTLAADEFYVIEHPMSEDCLYLNVWTPAKTVEEKLPVAVYIHGGAYETGYSYLNAYDGEGFAKRGVILVTIPYRLNLFGFLAHSELRAEDTFASTGNYGLLDQIAALDWVQRNIGSFGGDPENVTIFGQSAGASSVQNLCASPLAAGRFHRVIMQSGGGLSKNGFLEPFSLDMALQRGADFFDFANLENVDEARTKSDMYLLEKMQAFRAAKNLPVPIFGPVVDGRVLSMAAAEVFRAGGHPDIDFIVGSTADEMRTATPNPPPLETARRSARQRFGDLAEDYLQAIHADDPIATRQFYEDFFADETLAGCLAWCENQLVLGRRPTYMYHFTYVPPGAEHIGAHHSVEHHFVFQTLVRSKRPYTGFDFDLSEELADYWCNFIKTGNPNGDGTNTWSAYTEADPKVLEIGKTRRMVKLDPSPKVAFCRDFSLDRLPAGNKGK